MKLLTKLIYRSIVARSSYNYIFCVNRINKIDFSNWENQVIIDREFVCCENSIYPVKLSPRVL
jgi:hypothetical protein